MAARFTVPMRRPPGRERHFLLSIAFRPAAAAIREFVPAELTTDADLSPDACGRILKLRSTMGDLLADSYVPGRLILFTDWK